MEVISTRRYEARPPANSHTSVLVDPQNSIATVKEEEWETRKKKEIVTTRQIETRVKRQVVLEDGEVVVDSGPLVTTNTTEDIEQQEHTTQERRTTGDEPKKVEWPADKIAKGGIVQKELNETVVRSREEIEERLETEDRQKFGDITDEAYLQAIKNNRCGDIRIALAESSKQLSSNKGPRILQHTTRSNKVIDTEKTLEKSQLKNNGQIVTERKTTIEHEEIKDDEVPDDNDENDEVDNIQEIKKEATQRYLKTRDEEFIDYIVNGESKGREMKYLSEKIEAERTGDWPKEQTELKHSTLYKNGIDKKDTTTKKTLDVEEEDEARKFETSKWLESHFGSESRSSQDGSFDDEPIGHSTNTSFINVTMKSACSPRDKQQNRNNQTNSSSGFFQGISDWSERHHNTSTEKQINNNHIRAKSPPHYVAEPTREVSNRTNGYHHYPQNDSNSWNQKETSYSRRYERRHEERHSPLNERVTIIKRDPPSPQLQRKIREQVQQNSKSEKRYQETLSPVDHVDRAERIDRSHSPVHVVQRTWESRNKDVQNNYHKPTETTINIKRHSPTRTRVRPKSPVSRSPSPIRRDYNGGDYLSHEKYTGQSKYKIGESFRKLVGKLRSGSTDRKSKQYSNSQANHREDSSTYLQYNSVDRNVPLGNEYKSTVIDTPPERPSRSPRNATTVSVNVNSPQQKSSSSNNYRYNKNITSNSNQNNTTTYTTHSQPLQKYYLGEDPYGGSIYGKENSYRENKIHSKQHRSRPVKQEYSVEPSTLNRYSKSTSRLVNGYNDQDEINRNIQTLPRKMHISSSHQSTSSRHVKSMTTKTTTNSFEHSTPLSSAKLNKSPRQYGSMINISFKNTVTSPKNNIHTITPQPPAKPERTYKSVLSRSKSFNVEFKDNGIVNKSKPNGILSNYRSNTHLNRLDESPPLKSPAILASINRSNRDLYRNGKYGY